MNDAAFLTAMRLADSFLPVGTYTASYGIEQYVADGRIGTADELGALVEAYLRRVVGPAETVALANAHGAAAADDLEGILAADDRLSAATLPAEFRASSSKAGSKLLELLADTDEELLETADIDGAAAAYTNTVDEGMARGQYPVVLGVVTQCAGLERRAACLVGAYSFVTELLGAAQRLGRFGHTAIQSQLANLLPIVEDVCAKYAEADLETLTTFAPLVEIESMRHERADRRLFMS
ncbi:urease accessory protein UreF [Haloarchaeobius amylolyticus]|uniref:Urease accessory protein UreF n=1 Tax=Haloarchaeobius amylolyticus TaxID=1198296 RepID=A0ABD6BEX6_9EURY